MLIINFVRRDSVVLQTALLSSGSFEEFLHWQRMLEVYRHYLINNYLLSNFTKFLQVLCYKYINIYIHFKVNIMVNSPQNRPRRPRVGVEVYLYSFFNLGARWVCVVSATPRPLYPLERPGSHCIGGWFGPRDGLDLCVISRSHRDSIPRQFSP